MDKDTEEKYDKFDFLWGKNPEITKQDVKKFIEENFISHRLILKELENLKETRGYIAKDCVGGCDKTYLKALEDLKTILTGLMGKNL